MRCTDGKESKRKRHLWKLEESDSTKLPQILECHRNVHPREIR